MTTLILLLLVNALIIWGFWFACQFENYEGFDALDLRQRYPFKKPEDRMILWFVRFRLGKSFCNQYMKPVYLCPMCMSSLHGVIPFFFYYGVSLESILMFPFYVLALAGLNGIFSYKIFNE